MADRYAVATGNWNSTSVWSDSDGGSPGSSVPTSSDDVYFTATSGAITVTVPASTTGTSKKLDCSGFTGALVLSSNSYLWVYGSVITFPNTMTLTDNGAISVNISASLTLTAPGHTLPRLTYRAGTTTITLGSDIITQGVFLQSGTPTLTAGTYKVTVVAASVTLAPVNFYDLDVIPTTPAATQTLTLTGNITVSHNLTINGGASYRHYVCSSARGTARTITCNGTLTVSNGTDFEDITGAGTASWDLSAITGLSGDCGGNSGITFTTGQSNWLRGSGNRSFSTVANWANAVDGAAGTGRVPLPQDTAVLDATTGVGRVSFDVARTGSFLGSTHTGSLYFATYNSSYYFYGSVEFGDTEVESARYPYLYMRGRGTHTFRPGNDACWYATIDPITGSYTQQGDFTSVVWAMGGFSVSSGTYDANDFNIYGNNVAAGGTLTLYMGNGTWTCTGTVSFTPSTVYAEGSTIVAGDGYHQMATKTFNNFTLTAGANAYMYGGSPTFNTFTIPAGTAFRPYPSITITAANWVVNGTAASPITLTHGQAGTSTLAKSGGGTVTFQYCTISYITASPVSTFIGRNCTDAGNNTNWTWVTERFLAAAGGNWGSTSTWAYESGGAGGASVPTSAVDVFCDANSGSAVLTVEANGSCKSFDATGFVGTLAFSASRMLTCYGAVIKFSDGMTITGSGWSIKADADTGTVQLTTAGHALPYLFVWGGSGATLQLQDALLCGYLERWDMGFDVNGKAVTIWGDPEDPGAYAYVGGEGFTGENAFGSLTFLDGLTNELNCDIVADSIAAEAGATLSMDPLYTYSASSWSLNGEVGNPIILTTSRVRSYHPTMVKIGGGYVEMAYCTISYLTGSPTYTFFADPTCTNGGGNTAIYFNSLSTPGTPTGSAYPPVGLPSEFESTGSTVGGGTVEYQWTWGDGDVSDWGSDLSPEHTYDEPDSFDISLTSRLVENTSYSKTSGTFSVQAFGPPATPTGETDPLIGYSNTYSTTGCAAPEGETLEYSFNWDDGTSSDWSESLSASYAWSAAGNYDVTVTARVQSNPSITSTSSALAVTALAETISTPGTPTGTATIEQDALQTYTSTGATSGHGHTLEYNWDYGDGYTSGWGADLTITHRYTSTGSYSVTISARCVLHPTFGATSAGLAVTITGGIRDISWTCDRIIDVLQAGLPAKLAALDAEYTDSTVLEQVDNTNYHISELRLVDGYPLICVIPDEVDLLAGTLMPGQNLEHQYINIAIALTLNEGEDDLKRRASRLLRAIEDVLIGDTTLGGLVVDCLPLDKTYTSMLLEEDALIQEAQLRVRVTVLSIE